MFVKHDTRPFMLMIFATVSFLVFYILYKVQIDQSKRVHAIRGIEDESMNNPYLKHHSLNENYGQRITKKKDDRKNDELLVGFPLKELRQALRGKTKESNVTKTAKTVTEPSTSHFMSRVVYNRVGKCGSRSMLNLISKLSVRNHFTFYGSNISNQTRPSLPALKETMKIINELPSPWIYSRHIHFINFPKFGMIQPVYINMIRDPIDRFSSQYHFRRYGDHIKRGKRDFKDLGPTQLDINECILSNYTECTNRGMGYILSYFCGQKSFCSKPSKQTLEEAKENLLDKYLVVGYLEDFEGMLRVLEKLLPVFFNDALKTWKSMQTDTMQKTATFQKTEINETAHEILMQRMSYEYEFYEFAKNLFINLKHEVLQQEI